MSDMTVVPGIPLPPPAAQEQPHLLVEPSARTYTVAELVQNLRVGNIRVPHFQRGLRWGTEDARALIDSMLQGYPVGSLLLWHRSGPAERLQLGDVTIAAPKADSALYVVDGQQRLTTLLNVLDPTAGMSGKFALVYDLKKEPFTVRARRSNESESIPLPTLFDLSSLLRWTREKPEYIGIIEKLDAATAKLREFHIPAYEVRAEDDRALRQIYDRMNSSGKRLSRAEAFWGLYAPDESDEESRFSLADLQNHVAVALDWGQIDDDTIVKVFLARRGHDVTRDFHNEFTPSSRAKIDFPNEDQHVAHDATLEALTRTVLFLREDAKVPHFSFLAYRYLFVVLARFFAHFPEPDPRNRELLVRWYWRAALAGPALARGSATGAMRALALRIEPGKENRSVQNLLDMVEGKSAIAPDPRRFRANESAARVMACALWAARPLNPDTGEVFTQEELAVALGDDSTPNAVFLELAPRSDLPDGLKLSVGNRLLMPGIPGEVTKFLADGQYPLGGLRLADLGAEVTTAVQESHVLPPGGWTSASAEQVVQDRTDALANTIGSFLRRMAGDGLDDSRPLQSFDLDEDEFDEVVTDGSEEIS